MVKIGFLFPGQGAQTVGMGRDFYDASSRVKEIFAHAKDSINIDVAEICFNGPEERLTQTVNAQIAIFTVSVAIREVIRERYPEIQPFLSCGLSLGEYSALVSAGVLDFETTLRIVAQRGQLMEDAARKNPGGMVSIIGLSEDQCSRIARECDVDVANYNSPEQVVLSGLKENIQKAAESAVALGAKKAVILKVSGAFHSRLMRTAAEGMNAVFDTVKLHNPVSGFIPNVTAKLEDSGEAIKNNLILQVSQSVKWTQTMQYAAGAGVNYFLEIGPGKVLKGLARRINKDVTVISVEKEAALTDIEELLKIKE
ncbi:MAG: ACP S-malonyltransferase [Candidatus Omnitrophica bacterium]|nr:ACP S-malonyltransferase [Candidatus Omnitrophota bacterium]